MNIVTAEAEPNYADSSVCRDTGHIFCCTRWGTSRQNSS